MKEPLKDPSYHSTSCRCYWIMGEESFTTRGGIIILVITTIILVIIIIILIINMIITIIIALLEDGCEFKSPRK